MFIFFRCNCNYAAVTSVKYEYDIEQIKNNTFVTVNSDFGHEWGDLPMIFTSDEVTSENQWQITSRVTKIAIHGNECIILFLTRNFLF